MEKLKQFAKNTPFILSTYKNFRTLIAFLGLDFKKAYINLSGIGWYIKDYRKLKSQLNNQNLFPITQFRPFLYEKKDSSGVASGDYFHQDLYVARRIFENNPKRHIDVGSRIDGFVAHVACFREIEVFDIRPLSSSVKNIIFVKADLMKAKSEMYEITESLSCLHTIEHFGLGRYGDPIDADGHLKGLDSLFQMLIKGGKFYFSTPIGKQRIEFNAHRVFSVKYLLDIFVDKYTIDSFSYVDDNGQMHENVMLDPQSIDNNYGCRYGCGIFELTKK